MYGGETQSGEMLTDHSLVGKGEQEEIHEKKVDLKTDDDDIEGVFCLSQQKLADGSPGVTPDMCLLCPGSSPLCSQLGSFPHSVVCPRAVASFLLSSLSHQIEIGCLPGKRWL